LDFTFKLSWPAFVSPEDLRDAMLGLAVVAPPRWRRPSAVCEDEAPERMLGYNTLEEASKRCPTNWKKQKIIGYVDRTFFDATSRSCNPNKLNLW
jgi:hypothetical protein